MTKRYDRDIDEYFRKQKVSHVEWCDGCEHRTWHELRQRNRVKVWLCQPCRLDEESRERRRRYDERVAKTVQHYAEPRMEDDYVRTACGIQFDKGTGRRPKLAMGARDTNCKSCKKTEQYRAAPAENTISLVEWIGLVIPREAIVSQGGCT